jgi:succinate-semialdehyde dehydrogenase/glutarate-semialdehyde dehydrogenase
MSSSPLPAANRVGSTIPLKDERLFRQRCYIDGQWVDGADGATLSVNNPADNSTLGTVPAVSAAEVAGAIRAAHLALPAWRAQTGKQRSVVLRRWFDLCMAHLDDLAMILTMEQGKPLAEAKGEIAYGAGFIEWFSEEARRVYGEIIPQNVPGRRIVVTKEPIGVAATITPWNFPNAMITRKVGAALAAGCTVVSKPAMSTPYSALALAELADRAGLPHGVFNVVTGSAAVIGGELTSNPLVRKVSFTGSTEVGRKLLAQCAPQIKKVSMELGGNAPFIVFDDADLERAVAGVMASKFRNAGQTCVCPNRIFVQDGIYEAFAARLCEAVAALKTGHGTEPGVTIGPLIDTNAVLKVEEHIDDAVAHGASVMIGGKRHPLGGTFFEPTVLTNVPAGTKLMREETFGPVAPLTRFASEEDVIAMANDTEFGLASYFYTRDLGRAWRVGEALEYGIVGINEGLISTEIAPFGGFKQSGLGREGSHYGIDEYLEVKYMAMGGI